MVTDTLMVRDRILFLSFANGAVEDVAKMYASLEEERSKEISQHIVSLWNTDLTYDHTKIKEVVEALEDCLTYIQGWAYVEGSHAKVVFDRAEKAVSSIRREL